MQLREIYSNLGLTADLRSEIKKMNVRLNRIVGWIIEDPDFFTVEEQESSILDILNYELGADHSGLDDFIRYGDTEESLKDNLLAIQLILESIKSNSDWNRSHERYSKAIEIALNKSLVDSGYIVKDGVLLKSGAKELDEQLIIANLVWLEKYPQIKEPFSNSLQHYLQKKYKDSITNSYSALEASVKMLLKTKSGLDNDKTIGLFIARLGLEKEWEAVLTKYCKAAHEFSSRHGKIEEGLKDKQLPEKAEFFIYMTGTFLRLISRLSSEVK